MGIILRSAGKALPEKILTNDELATIIDTSDEWIKSHTGISERRIAKDDERASDFAVKACEEALKNANNPEKDLGKSSPHKVVRPEDIDLIIVSTATPDFPCLPAIACVLQRELGCTNAAAFDLNAACSGFLYAMDVACGLMERHNYKYALVCGAELLSKIVDWQDRGSCILFGDGSGAVLLENEQAVGEKITERGFTSFILGTDGTGVSALYGGEDGKIKMDGRAVYNFAVGIMAKTLMDLMEKENLSVDDVDYFLCHQANERILKAAGKRAKLPEEKIILNLANYGNTSSACIPMTLSSYIKDKRIKPGMTIVFAAFGAGLTWAGAILRT